MINRIKDTFTIFEAVIGLAVVASLVRKRDVYAWTDKSQADLHEIIDQAGEKLSDVLKAVE